MKGASVAAAGIFAWILATIECYYIFKKVEPLRKEALELKNKLERAVEDLANTKAKVKALQENVAILKQDGAIKQAELDELTETSNRMTKKLNTAQNLVRDLSSEKERWGLQMIDFQKDKVNLIGDCLVGSAFLSYCGPFNFEF